MCLLSRRDKISWNLLSAKLKKIFAVFELWATTRKTLTVKGDLLLMSLEVTGEQFC